MKKQWTTVADFVAYGKTNPKTDSIEVLGFDSKNDGGAVTLYRTGSVGTPSQSFTDTGNNTCIDANGDVWGLVEGTVVEFNGTDNWFGNGFGEFGQGSYKLSNNYWIDPITLAEQRNLGVGSSLYLGTGFTDGERHIVNGDDVPVGTTHLAVVINGRVENLIAWDELTLPTTINAAVPTTFNEFLECEVSTNQGIFKFVTEKTFNLRNGSSFDGSDCVYAAGFDVKGYTSAEVNQWLIANRNEPELRGVTFIEMGMNWTHIDTRPTTDDELLQLKTWKKFRALVNRVDTSLAPDIEWLEMTVGS